MPHTERNIENGNSQNNIQIIVFRLGEGDYALEISQIKEVVPTPSIASVPLTPPYIRGVANVRGKILAILDLERKFDLVENDQEGTYKYTLVVDNEELSMAILVKDVPNTLTVNQDEIEFSPNIIQQDTVGGNSYIKGIIKQDEKLIVLIDLNSIISQQEVMLALDAG